MATITSAQSGNFSDTATWVGGVVPGAADIAVAATGHTVAINVDVTVTEFQQAGTGKFTLGNGRVATGIVRGGTGTPTIEVIATTNATIVGNVFGSATTNATTAVTVTGAGTLTVNGNLTAGGGGSNRLPLSSSNGPVIINGNVTASLASSGVSTSGPSASVTVTGDVIGGTGSSFGLAHGVVTTGTSASVTVTGSVTGAAIGGNANSCGVATTGASATVTVTGNVAVTGIIVGGGFGVSTTGASATVTVTGNVTGGEVTGCHGIQTTGVSTTRINSIVGTCTGSAATSGLGSHAVLDTNTGGGWTAVGGSLIDSAQGDSAVNTRRFRCIPTLNTIRQHANNTGYPSGTPVTYGSLDYIPNNVPAPANVRSGTVYGNNQFTGTLAVPPASAVGSGVPVDNTVGTAVLTPEAAAAAVWNAQTSALTTTGSIGKRLSQAATVATTAAQIAAFEQPT